MDLRKCLGDHLTPKQCKQVIQQIEEILEIEVENTSADGLERIDNIEDLFICDVSYFKYSQEEDEDDQWDERLGILKEFRDRYVSLMSEIEDKIHSLDSEMNKEGLIGTINYEALENLIDTDVNLRALDASILSMEQNIMPLTMAKINLNCFVEIVYGADHCDVIEINLNINVDVNIDPSNGTLEVYGLDFKVLD